MSLTNRIAIAIGVHSLGPEAYWKLLFNKLGMEMNQDTLSFFVSIEKTRSLKNEKAKTTEKKAYRMKFEFDTLQAHTEEAKKERASRDGVAYQTGVGFTGGYTEEEIAAADVGAGGDTTSSKKVCKACNGTDHQRITSVKCPKHGEWLAKRTGVAPTTTAVTNSAAEEIARDAEESDKFDAINFTNDIEDPDDEEGNMSCIL